MQDIEIRPEQIQAAAEAVTEFVTVAFQTEFLCWEKEVNLAVAEMVWNFRTAAQSLRGDDGQQDGPQEEAEPSVFRVAPHLKPLHDRLADVRQARWPDADWMILGLDARVGDDGEIIFAFDLCWDDVRFRQPCEMTWVQNIASAVHLN